MEKTIKQLRQELADYKQRVREDENDIAMMRDIVTFKNNEIKTLKKRVKELDQKLDQEQVENATFRDEVAELDDLRDQLETLAFENANFATYLKNEGISHDDINSIALKGEYPYN